MAEPSPLAIYIHWPYCARICPYCDFNVYKHKSDPDLVSAIEADLTYWRGLSGARQVTSIHFGGGTPSLMRSVDISRILETVDRLWGLGIETEIALEANPVDLNQFKDFAKAGITRLSLGVQSFDDKALKFLGRDHDGETAKRAIKTATNMFRSVSVDLIFGWYGQSGSDLNRDIDILLALGVEHISTYQLTIEENTAFARAQKRGLRKAVSDDQSAGFYDLIQARLALEGFEHYEVSNFARPDHRSRHNLAYWQGYDYVGVGPGAHGRIQTKSDRLATIAYRRPQEYSVAVKANSHGIEIREILSPESQADEYVIMGLRISDGISMARWAAISGTTLPDQHISELIELGFLRQDDDRLMATENGRAVLNTITDQLLI